MIYFAIFTLGYFAGVFTFLYAFPPKTKEILEQEKDALTPIIQSKVEKAQENVSSTNITNPSYSKSF